MAPPHPTMSNTFTRPAVDDTAHLDRGEQGHGKRETVKIDADLKSGKGITAPLDRRGGTLGLYTADTKGRNYRNDQFEKGYSPEYDGHLVAPHEEGYEGWDRKKTKHEFEDEQEAKEYQEWWDSLSKLKEKDRIEWEEYKKQKKEKKEEEKRRKEEEGGHWGKGRKQEEAQKKRIKQINNHEVGGEVKATLVFPPHIDPLIGGGFPGPDNKDKQVEYHPPEHPPAPPAPEHQPEPEHKPEHPPAPPAPEHAPPPPPAPAPEKPKIEEGLHGLPAPKPGPQPDPEGAAKDASAVLGGPLKPGPIPDNKQTLPGLPPPEPGPEYDAWGAETRWQHGTKNLLKTRPNPPDAGWLKGVEAIPMDNTYYPEIRPGTEPLTPEQYAEFEKKRLEEAREDGDAVLGNSLKPRPGPEKEGLEALPPKPVPEHPVEKRTTVVKRGVIAIPEPAQTGEGILPKPLPTSTAQAKPKLEHHVKDKTDFELAERLLREQENRVKDIDPSQSSQAAAALQQAKNEVIISTERAQVADALSQEAPPYPAADAKEWVKGVPKPVGPSIDGKGQLKIPKKDSLPLLKDEIELKDRQLKVVGAPEEKLPKSKIIKIIKEHDQIEEVQRTTNKLDEQVDKRGVAAAKPSHTSKPKHHKKPHHTKAPDSDTGVKADDEAKLRGYASSRHLAGAAARKERQKVKDDMKNIKASLEEDRKYLASEAEARAAELVKAAEKAKDKVKDKMMDHDTFDPLAAHAAEEAREKANQKGSFTDESGSPMAAPAGGIQDPLNMHAIPAGHESGFPKFDTGAHANSVPVLGKAGDFEVNDWALFGIIGTWVVVLVVIMRIARNRRRSNGPVSLEDGRGLWAKIEMEEERDDKLN